MKHDLYVLVEAAAIFGVGARGISALLPGLGIKTKPVPHSPKARGLDSNDMARIAQALNQPWPPVRVGTAQTEAVA